MDRSNYYKTAEVDPLHDSTYETNARELEDLLQRFVTLAQRQRISAIRAWLAVTNMGLKDSKEAVDALLVKRCPHCRGVWE